MTISVNTAGVDWLLVRNWVSGEIETGRSRLECQQTENATNYERGQIAAFRRLLDQFEPVKTPETKDENYG